MAAEQEQFDPYRKWLGIPPAEQPPTHYRLLGIAEFEDDPDVIAHAADRCIAHVRTFQAGARVAQSQQILNELSAAQRCLLEPESKHLYDEQLRREKASPPPAPPPASSVPPPVGLAPPGHVPPAPIATPAAPTPAAPASAAVAEAAPAPAVGRSTSSVRQRVRRKSSPAPILITGGIICLVLVVILVNMLNRPPQGGGNAGPAGTLPGGGASPPNRTTRPPARPDEADPRTKILPSHEVGPGGKTPAESFTRLVDRARQSLARLDVSGAFDLLQRAENQSAPAEERERLVYVKRMAELIDRFQRALVASLESLPAGARFERGLGEDQQVLRFDEFNLASRSVKLSDVEMIYTTPLDQLQPELAVPLARRELDESNAGDKLAIATYLAVHRQGNLAAAQRILEELMESGAIDEGLLEELNLPAATSSAPLVEYRIIPPDASTLNDPPTDAPEKKPPLASPERLPVPDGEALLAAKKEVRDRFKDKLLAAKSAEAKTGLTEEIVQAAEESAAPAVQYELLMQALELSAEVVNLEAILEIVDYLAEDFQIDPLAIKTDYLVKANGNAANPDHGRELYIAAKDLFAEAKEAGQVDLARRIGRVAVGAARRAGDLDALRTAEVEVKKLNE